MGNLAANLNLYLDGAPDAPGRSPDARYASFDYCFNYFQTFRESGNVSALADAENLHVSCLQLGFYLASWEMLRRSAALLQKSIRCFIPVIEIIAATEMSLWEIDADQYTESTSNGCGSKPGYSAVRMARCPTPSSPSSCSGYLAVCQRLTPTSAGNSASLPSARKH